MGGMVPGAASMSLLTDLPTLLPFLHLRADRAKNRTIIVILGCRPALQNIPRKRGLVVQIQTGITFRGSRADPGQSVVITEREELCNLILILIHFYPPPTLCDTTSRRWPAIVHRSAKGMAVQCPAIVRP